MEVGSFLLGNKSLYRILRFEKRKLWAGAPEPIDVAIVIGLVDGIPEEQMIPKKDLGDFRDISGDIKLINQYFAGLQDDPTAIPEMHKVNQKNATLEKDVERLEEEKADLQEQVRLSEEKYKKLEEEFEDFKNSPAGIRLTHQEENDISSPESILEDYYGKGKKDNGDGDS